MPFIPHTEAEVREMLETIGVTSIDELFDEIPANLRSRLLEGLPDARSEMEVAALMSERARQDSGAACFIGAGAYDHHVPAAVWQLASRGEFYTAYTPYQAEASQGTLQLLYEYQTMMCELTGMDVSNTSMYDGASGLAEAVLMAVRGNRKSKSRRVLIPASLSPAYRRVTQNIVRNQQIELVEVAYDEATGQVDRQALDRFAGEDFAALVIPQPNFFGVLEDVDALTDWASNQGALSIAVVNPVALAVLTPPGQWGGNGVDICCGEGQPLGAPLSSGGPYFGFLCCRQSLVRQMPGRIIGQTVDLEGKRGFTLTLQAREQHIRRGKATSNICSNQGLMVTAATIHMALLGAEGLERVAASCMANTRKLVDALCRIPGVEPVFSSPFFHEAALRLPMPVQDALRSLAAHNILGGYALGQDYAELGEVLLVCATEKRTDAEIAAFAEKLERVISLQGGVKCRLVPDNAPGA